MPAQFSEMLAYVPMLRRYARALCGDPSQGDGLTGKTLDCAKSLLQFKPKEVATKVWLFSVMHNLTLEYLANIHGEITNRSVLPYINPAELGRAPDNELDVKGALAHLNLEQRETFLLTSLEQFRYDEICQILGINKAKLISNLQAARGAMCDYLFNETFNDFQQVQ